MTSSKTHRSSFEKKILARTSNKHTPFFMKKRKEGVIPITDPEMTRFNISIEDGVKMVLHALDNAWGGEIFIPKIP